LQEREHETLVHDSNVHYKKVEYNIMKVNDITYSDGRLIAAENDFLFYIFRDDYYGERNAYGGYIYATEHLDVIDKVKFVNYSLLVSSDSEGKIILWESTGYSLKQIKIFEAHTKRINDYLLTNNFFITASEDATIKIWDIKNGNCIKSYSDSKSIVITYRIKIIMNYVVSFCHK